MPAMTADREMSQAWLLNVPARCECRTGTDLLEQLYELPLYFYLCLPLIPLGASREERDVCLLRAGMPGQERCYTEIVSL